MKGRIFFLAVATSIVCLNSCQKSSENDLTTSGSNSELALTSNLKAAVATITTTDALELSSEDIQSIAVTNFDSIIRKSEPSHYNIAGGHFKFNIPHISDCATVTVSDTVYPKTITIDYGTGCTGKQGHVKKGKIIIEITDSIFVAGASKTITYQDFYVDSDKIELTALLTNIGQNSLGNWLIVSNCNQKITEADGDIIVETNIDTTEWVSGFGTADKSDDIYYKSGSGSTTINDSITYSRTITKPLLTDRTCGYISTGTVEIIRDGNIIIIDYGDGTCDNKATVTTNGTTEEINLASRSFNKTGNFGKHCPKHGGKHGH
jgi:hypothetical protein